MLIYNIKELCGVLEDGSLWKAGAEMSQLTRIKNAFLYIKDDIIADYGAMDSAEYQSYLASEKDTVDANGGLVLPAFCDSHTHLVYANSRELEFCDKIKGLSYEEIAKRGGGILNSAKATAAASEDELYESAMQRLNEIMYMGTGAVEIKSGYGLSTESELKMLRVIRRLKENSPLTIKSNFLGAHGIPMEYRGHQEDYVDLVINEMIPLVAAEDLADFIDVFCDKGFFTCEDTERILMAGIKYGMRPKIHANEMAVSGGVQVGVKYGAISVDHLEQMGAEEIESLIGSDTMPTVLPGCAFFLNLPLSPVRDMINAGLPVAMASDFNPGTSPSGNMQFVLSCACIRYKMSPEEALNATTLNTAYAMGVSEELGSITKGKIANVIITKPMTQLEFMPYYYGANKVEKVIIKGKIR
ncbi:MAG: imidazolonepropionase [Bacteroidales bacterium]|nr:imidazolonepropionase [Bacteroidales bacterium]MCI7377877.1 imidazolonepropionase [Bacteroidales bacterium]MDD7277179.1 imidazolonepropionase [Bacteroidales bacterium]MDY6075847.1 imidazolonepropionase [Bacteroidales bacterium]